MSLRWSFKLSCALERGREHLSGRVQTDEGGESAGDSGGLGDDAAADSAGSSHPGGGIVNDTAESQNYRVVEV